LPEHLKGKYYCWHQLPIEAKEVPVHAQVSRLHLLLGTAFRVEHGTAIAVLRGRYADGKTEETEVVYGRHIRNWRVQGDPRTPSEARVVWQGSNPTAKEAGTEVRIFHSSFNNPSPEVAVESVDIVSSMTTSAPFVLAITAECPGVKRVRGAASLGGSF
jgi:hypothetical protein